MPSDEVWLARYEQLSDEGIREHMSYLVKEVLECHDKLSSMLRRGEDLGRTLEYAWTELGFCHGMAEALRHAYRRRHGNAK